MGKQDEWRRIDEFFKSMMPDYYSVVVTWDEAWNGWVVSVDCKEGYPEISPVYFEAFLVELGRKYGERLSYVFNHHISKHPSFDVYISAGYSWVEIASMAGIGKI